MHDTTQTDSSKLAEDSILVLGVGELGEAVLRGLAASRAATDQQGNLSALVRPTSLKSDEKDKQRNLRALRSLGVNLVPGDLSEDTIAELSETFARFDTIICCTGFAAGPGSQIKITRAAIAAEVKRYVPWQFGANYDAIGRGSAQPLWDEQLDVRALLRGQDRIGWLVISTGMFTSFLFEPAFGVVDLTENTVHALGSWETKVTVTSPEDIGRLTAEILLTEPPISNRIIFTTGDTITYERVADTVEEVLNRKIQRVEWSVRYLRKQLAADPENTMKKYRVVFAEGTGVSWPIERSFNAQRDIATEDLKQWVQSNIEMQ